MSSEDRLGLEPAGGEATSPDTRARPGRSRRRRGAVLAVLALVFGALALGALLHRIVDLVRGTPVLAVLDDGFPLRTSDSGFAAVAGALTEAGLPGGHEVELLLDEALFARMLPELATATSSVTFLGYYCNEGSLGDRLAEVLAERARAGVRVLFLADHFGCRSLLNAVQEPLRAAGAQVAAFRPLRWYSMHRAQHRMHARSVVIDGRVGYTGGFGIDDKWIRDQDGEPRWRETSVRVTGPAVLQMQGAFLSAWGEATGALLAGAALLPTTPEAEGARAGFLFSRPGIGPTTAERYLALTIAAAERTLYVANSYFVPTEPLRRMLGDAARRGVDVRVLVPGERIDIPSTRYAGRGLYGELLEAGVRIYEYQPSMMHAKTLVADGVWASVGSLNLDNRSLRLNDESALLVLDSAFGSRLDSVFLSDLARAREVTLEAYRQRPLGARLLEWAMRRVAPLL